MSLHHRRLFVPALILALSSFAPPAFAQATNQDGLDVDHVMSAFHEAVVAHDGVRLSALFIPEGSTWFSVLSDDGYAALRATTPLIPKIRISSYKDFATLMSTSKAKMDPQHSNVRVLTDGTIASVFFDFRFMIDGKEQNRGSETWQLVNGISGWKIAAITYSSTPSRP